MSLLVSIHDVAPGTLPAVQRLRDMIGRQGVARATLLAVPNYHHEIRLDASVETARWLRERAEAGDEICLHGHVHQARHRPHGLDRLRAAAATAGEGECLQLEAAELDEMLVDGRKIVEDIIGKPVCGFVAPAWLEPPGFSQTLSARGFAWHESALWIERLTRGREQKYRFPVLGFATRTTARRIASLAYSGGLGILADMSPSAVVPRVRLALHPSDLGSPSVLGMVADLLHGLSAKHRGETYVHALGIE